MSCSKKTYPMLWIRLNFLHENDRNPRHIARVGSKKTQELLTAENMYCY